jgi:TonB family protein
MVAMRAVARWGWALLILGCSTRQAPPSVTAEAVGRVYEEAELDRPVSPITIPTPDYPRELQQAGAPGQVELEYIVGSDGRPEPASITVVSATEPGFGTEATKAIRNALFHPGVKGGQPVRTRVKQLMTFAVSSH